MMGAPQEITINDRRVMVREFILEEVYSLSTAGQQPADIIARVLECCSGIKREELAKFSASELVPLVKKITEVNEDFFVIAAELGMGEVAEGLKRMIKSLLILPLLDLSTQDTASASGDTPGPSSSDASAS